MANGGDSKRTVYNIVVVLLALGLVAALIALVFCWTSRSVPLAGSSETSASVSPTSTPNATETGGSADSESAATTNEEPSPEPSPSGQSAATSDVTHQPTFVVKTGTSGGGNTITLDYVEFLTGTAAEKAAQAHGDEVENDYYVVNDNPKLRKFPVSSSVAVKLHPVEDPEFTRAFSFSEFKALIAAGSATKTYGGKHYLWTSETTYYVNVQDGKVTRIENQWVP